METNQLSFPDSLAGELSAWKRQEQFFVEYGSAEDLKDKGFKKMKLREFDRLWVKYRGPSEHPDRVALLRVVQYHRTKLEQSLYPGIAGWFRKMLHRAALEGRNKLFGPRQEPAYTSFEGMEGILKPYVPNEQKPSQEPEPGQVQGRSTDLNQFKGWDYGAKKQQQKGKGLGI